MPFVLTNSGRNWLVGKLGATGGASFGATLYLGWGNGAGQVATNADTALFGEASTPRVVATLATTTTNVAGDTLGFSGTITADEQRTINNAGVLDAATGGNLILHADFQPLNIQIGDTVFFSFSFVFV